MSGADDVTVERDDHVFSKFSHFPVMAFLRAQTAPLHRELEQRAGAIDTFEMFRWWMSRDERH